MKTITVYPTPENGLTKPLTVRCRSRLKSPAPLSADVQNSLGGQAGVMQPRGSVSDPRRRQGTAWGQKTRFKSGPGHPKWVDDSIVIAKLMASSPYGNWEVIGGEIARRNGYRSVLCRCRVTHVEKLVHVDNLLSGKTTGSRGARTPSPARVIIGERYDAIKQRTGNPGAQQYQDYGGRGIKCLFSRSEFIDYVLNELPHTDYRKVQIDRINNMGHYEPGNLRLATPLENLTNTRRNRYVDYRGHRVVFGHVWHLIVRDHPLFGYSAGWTGKLIASGMAVEDVIKAGLAPGKRLAAGGQKPDPDVVALYEK